MPSQGSWRRPGSVKPMEQQDIKSESRGLLRSFRQYLPAIRRLPVGELLGKDDLCTDEFLLGRDGDLEIYYAPFDHLNTSASLCLVGVTPGWTQMKASFVAAYEAIAENLSEEEALKRSKFAASFSGAMRNNLVAMLDALGMHRALGIKSASDLFAKRTDLWHPTSAVRYPVFKSGKNYSGSSPELLRSGLLVPYVEDVLGPELRDVGGALIVPLGKAVESALSHLVARGVISEDRCLFGFPHPSGANASRVRQFGEQSERLTASIHRWFDSSSGGL